MSTTYYSSSKKYFRVGNTWHEANDALVPVMRTDLTVHIRMRCS
jgi:hypothetical protein